MEYKLRRTHILELTDSDLIALEDLIKIVYNARGTLLQQGEQQAVDLALQIKEQMKF